MVAIMNSSGAFIYGCTEEQADERIENHRQHKRGNLDYDEKGEYRPENEGMFAWFFMNESLVYNLIKLGCTTIYLNRSYKHGRDYKKVSEIDELSYLDTCLRKMISEKDKRKRG